MNIAVVQKEQARYYNPDTGRWLSEDIIGFASGDVNFYNYVKNNPLLYVDPDGEALTKSQLAAIGIVAAALAATYLGYEVSIRLIKQMIKSVIKEYNSTSACDKEKRNELMAKIREKQNSLRVNQRKQYQIEIKIKKLLNVRTPEVG